MPRSGGCLDLEPCTPTSRRHTRVKGLGSKIGVLNCGAFTCEGARARACSRPDWGLGVGNLGFSAAASLHNARDPVASCAGWDPGCLSSVSLSLSLSLSRSLSRILSLSLFLSLSRALSLSLALSFPLARQRERDNAMETPSHTAILSSTLLHSQVLAGHTASDNLAVWGFQSILWAVSRFVKLFTLNTRPVTPPK